MSIPDSKESALTEENIQQSDLASASLTAESLAGTGYSLPGQTPNTTEGLRRFFMNPETGMVMEAERGAWVRYVDAQAMNAELLEALQRAVEILSAEAYDTEPYRAVIAKATA